MKRMLFRSYRSIGVFCGISAAILFVTIFFSVFFSGRPVSFASAEPMNEVAAEPFGVFRMTAARVADVKTVTAGSVRAVTWNEMSPDGSAAPFYAISLDGRNIDRIAPASYELELRYASFDPLAKLPFIPAELYRSSAAGDNAKNAYIVQFVTQPVEEYREAIRQLGGELHIYLPNHAYIVQMDEKTRQQVASLPFVRWVGEYSPAFKIDETILPALLEQRLAKDRYNIMMLRRGGASQRAFGERVSKIGADVGRMTPQGFRVEAELTAEQLLTVLADPEVMFVDRWSPPENDMSVVRTVGGANMIETTLGFRGEGVRAEVMDNGLRTTHADFGSGNAPLIHNSPNTSESSPHGTSTFGINFGRGIADTSGRGLLPAAQGIFADYDHLTDRYAHTQQLLQAPYNAVYQSNSWGNALTTSYTTLSAEMDDILFLNDIVLLNSQSNNGNRSSRPQAWAKNVVSVGGVYHFNNANPADDRWNGGASIGPAADGRIKPDLAHYYDQIFAPLNTSNTTYTNFGGTSAATPITAGHFGLFYQMWHNGLFGNPTGSDVFASRPKMSTAKAIMINTADQWPMSGTDISRNVQGFGRVNVSNLYQLRNKMRIVNETDPLTNLQTRTYLMTVPAGSTDPLKITMVYTDPMGSPAATRARINDLSLRVTAPNGTIYWGNNGLQTALWSTSGGSANLVDTVENVFIQAPAAGVWRVEVIASEINQDARLESTAVDADFALVATGVAPLQPTAAAVSVDGRILTETGRPVRNARVVLSGPNEISRTAFTNAFGYYQFDGIVVGSTYVLQASSKQYTFVPEQLAITVNDSVANADFTAQPVN